MHVSNNIFMSKNLIIRIPLTVLCVNLVLTNLVFLVYGENCVTGSHNNCTPIILSCYRSSSSSSSSMILTNVPLGTKRPGDSNGPQSPLPHTLEPRVDECSFEVQSTVPAGLQNPRDRGTAGPRKKLTPAENFQNWKKKKKKHLRKK